MGRKTQGPSRGPCQAGPPCLRGTPGPAAPQADCRLLLGDAFCSPAGLFGTRTYERLRSTSAQLCRPLHLPPGLSHTCRLGCSLRRVTPIFLRIRVFAWGSGPSPGTCSISLGPVFRWD